MVKFKKNSDSALANTWSVGAFGAFYTAHRTELLAHANRILKDSVKSDEITQDALIKFMLAAPEIKSEAHALSYLHRTIENLCIDHFRAEGRKPNLVVLDDASAEIEATWAVDGDHSAVISEAEDAAIIRQAISLLSPAERAALVMWEIEGRSTAEIAAELGIKQSTVRHTVARARISLRRILTEVILDQERGLTAMDMLSTSYKKSTEFAKKSSKVTLSLLLVVTAFLGFNSMTGNEAVTNVISQVAPVTPNQSDSQDLPEISSDAADASPATTTSVQADLAAFYKGLNSLLNQVSYIQVATSNIGWAGLDSSGAPIGFSTNNGAYTDANRDGVSITTIGAGDFVLKSNLSSTTAYLNLAVSIEDDKSTLWLSPLFMSGENVINPALTDFSSVETRLADGSRLISAWATIDSSTSPLPLPPRVNVRMKVSADGSELISAASQFITNPSTKASA